MHTNTSNDVLVLEVIDGVFSLHRLNTVPCRIISIIGRKTFTTNHCRTKHCAENGNHGESRIDLKNRNPPFQREK